MRERGIRKFVTGRQPLPSFAAMRRFVLSHYDQVASSQHRAHYFYFYGNYYAAQAFYQFGGSRLRTFYDTLANDLLDSQAADGRWRNRVGPGDELGTSVACILLQMPRQYLPIFQR